MSESGRALQLCHNKGSLSPRERGPGAGSSVKQESPGGKYNARNIESEHLFKKKKKLLVGSLTSVSYSLLLLDTTSLIAQRLGIKAKLASFKILYCLLGVPHFLS